MTPLQMLTAELLFETASSRATLRLIDASGRLSIVGEAVRDGLSQVRNGDAEFDFRSSPEARTLEQTKDILVQDEVAAPATAQGAGERDAISARMFVPILSGDRLTGVVSVEQARDTRHWQEKDIETLRRAPDKVAAVMASQNAHSLTATSKDVQDAAIQAILDRMRPALNVQRCTFRQDVLSAYAFPVTHETRERNVRSLYGDFSVVQSGQPVIEKMLSERAQVVHDDCSIASDDPAFHSMLKHYGGMRSQIVTPFIRDGKLGGALSIHDLRAPRKWTDDEKKLAYDAAQMIGHLSGIALSD